MGEASPKQAIVSKRKLNLAKMEFRIASRIFAWQGSILAKKKPVGRYHLSFLKCSTKW
jgi:hypothetical protein